MFYLREDGSNAEFCPLPQWAEFFLSVGESAIEYQSEHRLVIAIIVPVKMYVAPLIASGVVLKSIRMTKGSVDAMEHFQMLAALPRGTPVCIVRGGQIKKGLLVGPRIQCGCKLIGVQTRRESIEFFRINDCIHISLAASEHVRLTKRQHYHPLESAGCLPTGLLSADELKNFCESTSFECVIVGSRTRLHEEICANIFAFKDNDKYCVGSLSQILREKSTVAGEQPWRSQIIHTGASTTLRRKDSLHPRTVIVETGRGLSRWQNVWPESKMIAILERTDPDLMEAVNDVNSRYYTRMQDSTLPSIKPLPKGVELICFNHKGI